MTSKLRKLVVVTIALAVMAISAYMYAPIWIRHKIKEKADTYGIQIDVGKVELHFNRVVLSDIPISSSYFPGQKLSISTATVYFGLSGIHQIVISGGDLKITGIFSEIKKQFSEWGHRSTSANTSEHKSKFDIKFDSINATWQSPYNGINQISVDGINNSNSNINANAITIDTAAGSTHISHVEYENESKTLSINTIKSEVNDLGPIKLLQSQNEPQNKSTLGNDENALYRIHVTSYELKAMDHEIIASDVILRMHPFSIQAREANVDNKIKMISPWVSIQKLPQGLSSIVSIESITTSNPTITDETIITKPIALSLRIIDQYAEIEASIYKTPFKLGIHKDDNVIRFDLIMEKTPCQDILDSIPQGVKSVINEMKLDGSLSWEVRGLVDLIPETQLRMDPEIELKLSNSCKITKIPDELSVTKLRKPFKRIVLDQTKTPFEITNGPGTEGWVPNGLVSQFVALSFRTMEDPGFLAHHGFDIQAIENSIKENIKSKKFLRGASTITMQLAKNLWLNRSKTLARKIQEAFLTMYLEQALNKDEILELYMNVVEFGPKIYGIGKASRYYFNKYPTDLTLGQSLFLASVLPNPKVQFFDANGDLNPKRADYLKRVMKAMMDRKLISQDEYDDGVKEVLKFKRSSVATDEIVEIQPDPDPWQVSVTQ